MSAVLEKLQKLISHEKSARGIGSQAEAEAFSAKIQELLFANNLSMSEIEVQEQERDEPIESEYVRDTGMGRIGSRVEWLEDLASPVADAAFCQHLIVPGSNVQIFVGRTSDRLAAAEMFRYLASSAMGICETEFKTWKDGNSSNADRWLDWSAAHKAAQSRRWKKSFLLGFASAICQRLRTDRRSLEASAQGSPGLVLIQRKERAVELHIAEQLKGRKPARGIGNCDLNWSAFSSGRARGAAISLKSRTALGSGGAR